MLVDEGKSFSSSESDSVGRSSPEVTGEDVIWAGFSVVCEASARALGTDAISILWLVKGTVVTSSLICMSEVMITTGMVPEDVTVGVSGESRETEADTSTPELDSGNVVTRGSVGVKPTLGTC